MAVRAVWIDMKRIRTVAVTATLLLVVTACNGGDADETTTSAPTDTTTTSRQETTTTPGPTTTTLGQTSSSVGSGADAEIRIANFTFLVGASIGVGDTVRVTNEDQISHTWTAVNGEFDSGTLSSGSSFEFTFEEAGEYQFFCKFHPTQMTGSITVQG